MLLEALTFGLMGLGMYGMADEVKKIQKEHSKELKKNQGKLIKEQEEKGYANFEEATSARVDYAMEKALFPGEPITTTIHALHACLMDDEDIIYKQTGKKYKKRESPLEYNIRMFEENNIEFGELYAPLLKYDLFKRLTKEQLDKIKEEEKLNETLRSQ